MKKLIGLLLIFTSLATISCSKNNEDAVAPAATDLLLGRWYYVSGVSAPVKEVVKLKTIFTAQNSAVAVSKYKYLEFKKSPESKDFFTEGTQTGTTASDNSASNYTRSGNTLNVVSADAKQVQSIITISKLTETELIIVYGANSGRQGDTETYTKDITKAADLNKWY